MRPEVRSPVGGNMILKGGAACGSSLTLSSTSACHVSHMQPCPPRSVCVCVCGLSATAAAAFELLSRVEEVTSDRLPTP